MTHDAPKSDAPNEQKGSVYVPHDQSKEILLGLRNYLGSMYEKSQIIITHTFALIKCLPGMYREMLRENGS